MTHIGFIGAGKMAQALAAGIALTDTQVEFLISDPVAAAQQAFSHAVGNATTRIAESSTAVFNSCSIVFLAVKPQSLDLALANLQLDLDSRPLIVSVMAGIRSDRIQTLTGIDRVIRVMPNTPCLIGHGVCAMSAPTSVAPTDIELIGEYLKSVGMVVSVPESMLDVVTGLSGSGPAFVFKFMEALIEGAVDEGMPRELAYELTIQTVVGAALMAQQSNDDISVLRDRVTSPGGTTLAGLDAMKANHFQATVKSAVQAATERARELGN